MGTEEDDRAAAAAKIQALQRGKQARKAKTDGTLDNHRDPDRDSKIQRKKAKAKKMSEGEVEEGEFRSWLMNKDKELLDKKAEKIQSRFKGRQTRKKLKASTDVQQQERKEFLIRQAQHEEIRIDPTTLHGDDAEEAEKLEEVKLERAHGDLLHKLEEKKAHERDEQELAAIRIQSHFKGHATRKNMHKLEEQREVQFRKKERERLEHRIEMDDEQAAVAIQSRFKGYQARKKVYYHHKTKATGPKHIKQYKPEVIQQQTGWGPMLTHEEKKAQECIEKAITGWSKSYMHYLKYLGNTAGRITFDSIWSKPTKEKPIPSTVVHVIFTVTNIDSDEPTMRFMIENQASTYTVGSTGWQQPFHDYWLDLVVEDKRNFVSKFKM